MKSVFPINKHLTPEACFLILIFFFNFNFFYFIELLNLMLIIVLFYFCDLKNKQINRCENNNVTCYQLRLPFH
jgi:hypothetical protein